MVSISTTGGMVSGSVEGGIHAYKGIPYAAPITGEARWAAPAPPTRWDGTRPCTRFGSVCPQEKPPNRWLAGRAGKRFIDTIWKDEPQADDCLNLNVWTPSPDPAARLPVMFWIHGGAFTTGSGSLPLYDGTALAAHGVVVVSINYRLGMMGSFVAPDRYDEHFCVSNRGFRDQIAALRWTQENIEAFGGDPDSVTIFGESAGGQSVAVLLASPPAAGLFRRAIAQSGTPELGSAIADHGPFADDLLTAMGVPLGDRGALAALTADDTIRATRHVRRLLGKGSEDRYGSIMTHGNIGAMHGDDVLPVSILDGLADGASSDVDVMVGTVREDGRLFPLVMPGPEAGAGALSMKLFGALMNPKRQPKVAQERYRAAMPDASANEVRSQILTDSMFRRGTVAAAEAHQGRTFLYQFDWASPVLDGAIGAIHGIDVPFTNGNLEACSPLLGDLDEIRELADTTIRTWVAFATDGTPAAPGLPEWPTFEADTRATMVFDTAIELEHDVDPHLRAIW